VCKNFSRGGFGATRARRGNHGEGGARVRFDNDFVFTDNDVVDQILQVDAGSCSVTPKERLAQSSLEPLDGLGLVKVGRH